MQDIFAFLKDWKKALWLVFALLALAIPVRIIWTGFSHPVFFVHYGVLILSLLPFASLLIYGIVAHNSKLITTHPRLAMTLDAPSRPIFYVVFGLLFTLPTLVLVVLSKILWGAFLFPATLSSVQVCMILPIFKFCQLGNGGFVEFTQSLVYSFMTGVFFLILGLVRYLVIRYKRKFYYGAFVLILLLCGVWAVNQIPVKVLNFCGYACKEKAVEAARPTTSMVDAELNKAAYCTTNADCVEIKGPGIWWCGQLVNTKEQERLRNLMYSARSFGDSVCHSGSKTIACENNRCTYKI